MESEAHIVELDVRPYLRKKLEPFQMIMDAVKQLDKEDTFVLHATFKPTPLIGVMKTKGFAAKMERIQKDHWIVTFVHKSRKDTFQESETQNPTQPAAADNGSEPKAYELDNRGLEPPQPMMRTLGRLESCRPGDKVIIHNDRVPLFLLEELNALGYPYAIDERPDGSAKVTISKV